jgi:hypothetical protein
MTCSICKQEGHRCNNKKFHPTAATEPVDMEKTPFDVFLETKSQGLIRENDAEIIAAAETREKDLLVRIENFRREKLTEEERVENTVDSILEAIKTSVPLRAQFRKDPTRQSIHEKAQIEWIQKHQYPAAVKMSADIHGTCLVKNKFHVIGKDTPRPSDATKTFDLHVAANKMYAVLKYTSCPGGAQDNQLADVKNFIRQAANYLTENAEAEETFAFYLDGPYYTAKKVAALESMIPPALKGRMLFTNCASIHA